MSSVEASGQDAFDFLSNISFGAPDSTGKTPKKSKSSSSRSSSLAKPGNASKLSKATSHELSESRTRNSKFATSHTEDSLGKTASTSSSKHVESSHSVVKSKSVSLPKDSHRDVRPQPDAALDFLSGISLGGSGAEDTIDIGRATSRESTSKSRDTNSFDLPGMTPTKSSSVPISPRGAKVTAYEAYRSETIMDEMAVPTTHEEELGVHETTNLLFASLEEPVPHKEPVSHTTVIPSKSFTSSAKKTVKNMVDGQRTMWAFPSNQTARLGSYLSVYQPSPLRTHVPTARSSRLGESKMQYGAVVVSSIIYLDKENNSTANTSGSSPGSSTYGTDKSEDSDPSDSPRDSSHAHSHTMSSRFGKHAMKFLHPKKKTSVSYQHYLTPSPKSAILNAQILARLPTFTLPREMLISSGDIFRSEDNMTPDSTSTPTTPRSHKGKSRITHDDTPSPAHSPLKHSGGLFTLTPLAPGSRSPPQARRNPKTGKSREELFYASSPTKHSTLSGDIEPTIDHTTDHEPKMSKTHSSKHSEGSSTEPLTKPKSRSNSVSVDPTSSQIATQYILPELSPISESVIAPGVIDGLPQSPLNSNTSTAAPANVLQPMDPYERCLQSYEADFLDNDIEKPGKYLIKSHLPGYTSSLMPVQSSKLVRQEENESFQNRHHWLTTDIKLSKIRSVKRKLEQVAIAQLVDIACTALSYVYFEKLILRNIVSNHNARLYGAVCLFLAAKFYGFKLASFMPLLKELGNKLKVSPKDILANEFFIYRKLRFALFVEPEEVLPHFLRLRASPAYLDREFAVQQKERKRHQKKHAFQSHSAAGAPSNDLTTSSQSRVSQQFHGR